MKYVHTLGFLLAIAGTGCFGGADPGGSAENAATGKENIPPDTLSGAAGEAGDTCGGITGAQCDQGLYCNYPTEALCGAADATGTCAVIPQICTKQYDPVCGCGDVTYGNACEAAANGVSVAYEGECTQASSGAQEGELCGGFVGVACEGDLFCDFPPETSCGSGDQSGVCKARPGGCTKIYDPVCGCDGQTYGNACTAAAAGVSVASTGECGPVVLQEGDSCGGLTEVPRVCGPGLFCAYTLEAECGDWDATGTCAVKPGGCPQVFDPVCGCDGQTYGNACTAASAGVAVRSDGACP